MLATIQSRTFCLFCLLSKNVDIRIYKTIILPVILYGCQSWCLILREERRLKVRTILRSICTEERRDSRLEETA
jgi:hypothetical protein